MKSRFLFSILVLCVVALIVVAARLTTSFFDLSRLNESFSEKTENQKPIVDQPAKPVETVMEEIIEATEPVKTPAKPKPITKTPTPETVSEPPILFAPARKQPQESDTKPEPDLKKPDRPGIGTVIVSTGKATGTREKMVQRDLKVNARIYLNEKIETGSNSRIEIKFDDGSTISQGENSSLVIDEYVYKPDDKEKNRFGMRIVKGVCRVVTGMITELNPKRFNVRTRMATIGIRGCELAFRSEKERDDIYVIGLSGERIIEVVASKTGKHITNVHTGKPIPKGRTDLVTYTIPKPLQMISVTSGQGIDQREMNPKDIREMVEESTSMAPARYDMQNSQSGAIFLLKPPTRVTDVDK